MQKTGKYKENPSIHPSIHLYLSNNKQLKMQMKHAVRQDSETESTEHCPKYKQSTVTQIQLENRHIVKTSKTSSNRK